MGTNRQNGSIYTSIRQGVAHLEFGHPAGNSFVSEMLERLTNEFQTLSQNRDVQVIVLRSEGDSAFCAGASLNEMAAVQHEEQAAEFFSGFAHALNAMRQSPKLTIGRVHGKTIGGGVGLVAACDYVFATEAASVRLSELSIGIAPLVIAPAVVRKIGEAGLAGLALAPTEWKTAYWAQEKGLYSQVFEQMQEMDKELDAFAQRLASYAPEALTRIKSVLWEGTDHWETLLPQRAAETGRLALGSHTRQALEKFRTK